MKITLPYIIILFTLPLQGQLLIQNDTIKIGEVIINRKSPDAETPGFKSVIIDSLVLNNYSHKNLADLLSEYPAIFIKSYGMGGTATPSFRGTGAGHTRITWNNININHPMLGQSDLSIIPTGLIDDIRISYGGASMAYNSGGIGGSINLETKPSWNKATSVFLNPGIGSFGQYSGLVKVRSGGAHFETITKLFLQSSENDFRYLNTEISNEPVWETRKNSQVSQRGFIQELYYKKAKNIASARIWYQSANRRLPPSMLSQQVNSGEKQFDETFRTMLNYDLFGKRTNYSFTGAFLLSTLNYSNRLASINSLNLSEMFFMNVRTESPVGENIVLKVDFGEEVNLIKSNNYVRNETRGTTTLTVSAERKMDMRFGATILLREIYYNHLFLIPDFSAGLQYRIIDNQDYFLKANISRNSKLPSMNDLFWMPGGNAELKNEYAFTYELSYQMKQNILTPLMMLYDISAFCNTIKDMIQWLPGEYSYWTADNIKNVNTMGIESSLSLKYSGNNFESTFASGYSFIKAAEKDTDIQNNDSQGKQLMYIPIHQANASLRIRFHNYYTSWIANMTGKRYITVDNSRFLPAYFLNNIMAGVKINLKNTLLDINLNIDNLFSINYQTIAYYPQPGRSYSLKLLLQITK